MNDPLRPFTAIDPISNGMNKELKRRAEIAKRQMNREKIRKILRLKRKHGFIKDKAPQFRLKRSRYMN